MAEVKTDGGGVAALCLQHSHCLLYTSHYELKTAEDGKRYITPGKSAKPDVYNLLKEVPNIVLDALNVGMLMKMCIRDRFQALGSPG